MRDSFKLRYMLTKIVTNRDKLAYMFYKTLKVTFIQYQVFYMPLKGEYNNQSHV